ncbi:MAG TPA: DUF3467 domain-containing protein [Aggregatilineales bacterium]|nr:DUF3467 domain-containing protein [Aggregatilineales bacterium]
MSEKQTPPGKHIKIEIPSALRSIYSNFALISHTGMEFFIDFAQLIPGINRAQVHSRIVMTPTHAKMLYRALGDNLDRYEAQHGEIEVPPSLADQLFSGIRLPDGTIESVEEENNE